MKIQGPNPYLNIYKTNQRTVKTSKNESIKDDQLKISSEALQLLQSGKNVERKEKVSEIKSLVQSGEFKIDYEKTAEKLLKFWRE